MSYFICHGSPTLAIQKNEYTDFLAKLGKNLEQADAIVLFTAHWESPVTTISSHNDVYETIYDFGGFSEALFSIKYPAHGSSEIANKVKACLSKKDINSQLNDTRGLDHGAWVILHHLLPSASVPIVQVSVNPFQTLEDQVKIGVALKELEQDNVIVIGSGGTVHNLRTLNRLTSEAEQWPVEFDDWLVEKVLNKEYPALFDFEQLAPHAKKAVPRPEHFVPLYIAMGAGNKATPELLFRGYDYGTLSHICFRF